MSALFAVSAAGALAVGLAAAQQPAPRAGSASAKLAAAYAAADPKLPVQVIDETLLTDPKRKKDVPVKAVVPQAGGPYPVIVFSHGVSGSKDCCDELAKFWAGHGYAVLLPTHGDSLALQRQRRQAAPEPKPRIQRAAAALRDPSVWEARARDVSFLLDSLTTLEEKMPELKGKLDSQRIGVGGHSFGAFTAQLIGGAVVDIPGEDVKKTFADPRADALLLLSGQGRGQHGLTETSWQKLARPMMSMTGSRDRGAKGQAPDWKKEPFDFSPPGHKYHVFIHGAAHASFIGAADEDRTKKQNKKGAPASDEPAAENPKPDPAQQKLLAEQKQIFRWVEQATTAFWDAYVKKDAAAKAWLEAKTLETSSGGKVQLWKK